MERKMTEEEMFLSNQKLIYLAIKDLRLHQYEMEDLKQMGGIGLLKAIRGFDEEKGYKFSTYAMITIRKTILNQLRQSNPVYVPNHIRDLAFKIKKNNWKNKSPEWIANETNHSVAMIENALKAMDIQAFNPKSLDESQSNENESYTLLNQLPDKTNDYDLDLLLTVNEALQGIPSELKKILHMRYVQELTQTEIGKIYNTSQVQIGRKVQKALNMLREVLADG